MDITLDTYVISDTHFGHKYALKKWPARSVAFNNSHYKDFDELSVELWNESVSKEDKILHVGDLFNDRHDILSKLNGEKILVVGNNDVGKYELLSNSKDWKVIKKIKFKIKDKELFKKEMKRKWGSELKNPYATALIVDVNNIRIMFSHFPVGERRGDSKYNMARDIIDYAYFLTKCDVNIHGHIHSRDSIQDYCINVSTERLQFRPRKLRDIFTLYTNLLHS